MKDKRLLFVITEDWALVSHRLHLAEAAVKAGYDVGVLTSLSRFEGQLTDCGLKVFNWRLNRGSLNPIREFISIFELFRVIVDFRPNIVHSVAIKPIIYAGLVLKFFNKIKFVAAMGGVGYIFASNSIEARVLRPLVVVCLRLALRKKGAVLILQNNDNIRTITDYGIANKVDIRLIRGAGVEIEKFFLTHIPEGVPLVVLPARLLADKGVLEFVSVARRIKNNSIKARFVLVGDIDPHNPAAVSQTQIDSWVSEGVVEHWSRCENMMSVYRQATVICLPSHHEGLPKVLLEAMSCGRPTVAFDVPGCREVVRHRVNGLLLRFGDLSALEDAITLLITDRQLCERMGAAGREIIEKEFSDKIVNFNTFSVWEEA